MAHKKKAHMKSKMKGYEHMAPPELKKHMKEESHLLKEKVLKKSGSRGR